ncbi:MAG TPA: hypothetical protein VGD65_05040 [Chryseosolibacter sp.]
MKTLKNHIILYDNECPVCDLYTSAFVKAGMLEKEGRTAYTDANTIFTTTNIDRAKACDEIALVDTKTGAVSYGVDSLVKILGNGFPRLNMLFKSRLVTALARKLYFFISYNRKVIVPGRNVENACRPSFNLNYRVAYLLFTWLVTSVILTHYVAHLQPLIPPTNFYREFVICGGQIVFQGIIMFIIDRKNAFEYLGNMMTISFAGGLLLSLALAFSSVVTAPVFFLTWFTMVVIVMFIEHCRRMTVVQLPWIMSFSWIIYRIIVLAVLL